MKPLLIGQAPGPNTDPRLPLYPLPSTSAGGRLAEFMGLSRTQYLRSFDRVNVLQEFPGKYERDDKFPVAQAKIAAAAMKPFLSGRDVVFVGRSVADVFGYKGIDFCTWYQDDSLETYFACIPHTSGRNFWYNKEENRSLVRRFWDDFLAKKGLPTPLDTGNLVLQA